MTATHVPGLEVVTCRKQAAHVQALPEQAWEAWATYADMLLHGAEIEEFTFLKGFEFDPDSHIVSIGLVIKPTLATDWAKSKLMAQVYFTCPHEAEVAEKETATSRLILPEGVKL